jgi:hypothetical protein
MKNCECNKKIKIGSLLAAVALSLATCLPSEAVTCEAETSEAVNTTSASLPTAVSKLLYRGFFTEGIIEKGLSIDMVSGPTRGMPWENDEDFIEARSRNDTNVILGGYRTVLRDPLPGEEYNVHLAASLLAGIVVKSGEDFSQNTAIGPYTEDKGFEKGPTYLGTTLTQTVGGGVCKIASTLYNVAVLSNLEILERHNHTMPVPYVPYGQDATVAYGIKDLRFRNSTDSDIMIWAKGIDNTLYIAFYGSRPGPAVEWSHQVREISKAPVLYKINPTCEPGEERLLVEGMDGAVVKSWVKICNGSDTETRYMGISNYKPMPHIVEKGRE